MLAGLPLFAALALAGGGPLAPAAWEVREAGEPEADGEPTAGPADDEITAGPAADDEPARRGRLAVLSAALWVYAEAHDGNLPPSVAASRFDPATWRTADRGGTQFVHVPGGRRGDAGRVVAYEPGLHGDERLALFGDGTIRRLPLAAILQATPAGGRP